MSALNPILQKHQVLQARLNDARLQYERLASEVGQAKSRVELEPEIQEVLEELQRREHERAVGAYEELLTLFLRDVLPGDRDVVMDLRTERSMPALDVFLKKGADMPLEDALHGTGGSVTNILSSGLRFIALIRSNQRPFLVLDEPDCWIKPDLAPKFASVIQSVAEQLGVQVLMISHHDEQMFEEILPHRLRLEKSGHQLSASWAPTSELPQWEDDQAGLRSIELVNFQSHRHTFIPLSPGVTLLNGENDIGKSAIVNALRAVLDGKGNDKQIRHYQKFARVAMDFGPDHVLIWERMAKGSPKEIYELRARNSTPDADPLRKSLGADVPEWVNNLGIGLVDELDIQLGNQQEPVFLLGRSPRDRAKALAVGGENAHVQEMMAASKEELNQARTLVRSGEKQLETLHRTKQVLEQVLPQEKSLEQLEQEQERLLSSEKFRLEAEKILLRWKAAQTMNKTLGHLTQLLPQPPQAPRPQGLERQLLARWEQSKTIQKTLSSLRQSHLPSLPKVISKQSEQLHERWIKAREMILVYRNLTQHRFLDVPIPPKDNRFNEHLVSRWNKARNKIAVLNNLGQLNLDIPVPTKTRSMEQLWNKWQTVQRKQLVLSQLSQEPPKLPVVEDQRLAWKILNRWKQACYIQGILKNVSHRPFVEKPQTASLLVPEQLLARWKQSQQFEQERKKDLLSSQEKMKKIQEQLSVMSCPTCGQTLPSHQH